MIGYDDIKSVVQASNNSGLRPDEELQQAGIDPDAAVEIANEMAGHTLFLLQQLGPESFPSVVASVFLSGFGMGVAVANAVPETV